MDLPRAHNDWVSIVTVLDIDLVVACDVSLRSTIEPLLAPWTYRTIAGADAESVRIGQGPPSETAPLYILSRDGQIVGRATGREELLVVVQNWLDDEVTRLATHVTPVHAGVVTWGGKAALLPGRSGAGKTRLVSALLDAGATYCSDERAFLDEIGSVHPYPRHLIFRDGLGVRRSTAPSASTPIADGPAPVRLIVGLEFGADHSFEIRRIDASEAVLLLLVNSAHRLSGDRGIPPGLVRAAANAEAYVGTRGDADRAAAAILDLLGRSPA